MAEEKHSTATSRARFAERMSGRSSTSSTSDLPDVTENRPSAATRHVERMRREREQRGCVIPEGIDIEERVAADRSRWSRRVFDVTLRRIIIAMLVLEHAQDEAEKVARRIRDQKKLDDLLSQETRQRESLAWTIRHREELEIAMRDGTTPPTRRPEKKRALELLANSDYDVCVQCGYFDAANPTPPPTCPGCGATASQDEIVEDESTHDGSRRTWHLGK